MPLDLNNIDWTKRTFDFPGVKTVDQMLEKLELIGMTPEHFLQLPAARVDHPVVHELRQHVYEKHGGQGKLNTSSA